ncbi:molybdopterin-binding protein [Acidicapsa acidisoli]|uniref:hypothetical protein n=1 Tax=Acidicapsa acidisoli TaxID=1615681 RepID=UPI0021DF7E68|nr:hypothetical protein [Acidicapsa acidisoli]
MRKLIWTSALFPALAVLAILSPSDLRSQAPAQPAGEMKMDAHSTPSTSLKITYAGKSEDFTPATLAALPHTTITVYNEHAKASQTYSGVPLSTLLARLGVPEKPRGKDFRLYLLAEGTDGYGVVYSVGEVTPDVHDGTTLVADTLDGKPLADNGQFQLVTTGEKRPARWVRNLASIHVLTAQE